MVPLQIPQKRQNRDVRLKIIACFVLEFTGWILTAHNSWQYLSGSIVYCYFVILMKEFILRTCDLREEYYHLNSRYRGSLLKMLQATYSINNYSFAGVIITLVWLPFVYVTQGGPEKCVRQWGVVSTLCSMLTTLIYTNLTKLEFSTVSSAKLMDSNQILNVGSVLAHGFYCGYLKLILPDHGNMSKGLNEQLDDYASRNGVTFKSKKLYILIPLSLYCPPTLDQCSNGIVERAGSLDWQRINRAGVQGRQYHNSVYKLWPNANEMPYYVCVEYASPLLTLSKIMEREPLYKQFHFDIVTNFYMTLSEILSADQSFHGLYELIYYPDLDCNDRRIPIDIGILLLEKLNRET